MNNGPYQGPLTCNENGQTYWENETGVPLIITAAFIVAGSGNPAQLHVYIMSFNEIQNVKYYFYSNVYFSTNPNPPTPGLRIS